MKARLIMTSPPPSLAQYASLEDAARLLLEQNIDAAPVVDSHGRVVGIVSAHALARVRSTAASAQRGKAGACTGSGGNVQKVVEVMTTQMTTAEPDTSLDQLRTLFANAPGGVVIPIVGDGRLVGTVSQADLAWADRWQCGLIAPSDAWMRAFLLTDLVRLRT